MTDTDEDHEHVDCIEVAARFVAAQPGAVRRILTTHRRSADGCCTGCLATPTRWPCTVAAIAMRAEHL